MFLLFEKCEDREFFLSICMEKGIGEKLVGFGNFVDFWNYLI